MGRTIAARKSIRSNRITRLHRAACETLEERQLMSLTIEVRDTSGGTSATVTQIGQQINLEVLAVITDANNAPTTDGLEDIDGNFLSAAFDGHAIAGNLTSANVAPFNANGASPGTPQDLNGDGNIDIGAPATGSSTQGQFFARSSPAYTGTSPGGYSTVAGNALQFKIATLVYTVTSLNEGGATNINFQPYSSAIPDAAGWIEDGGEKDNTNGTFQAGTPFVVSDPTIIPAPVANNSSFTVVRNTPTTLDELAGDDIVVAINPSSVVISSPPAHGSATKITGGSTAGQILYTPVAGYLGTDSFTYHMSDNDGRTSNDATVSINVVMPAPPTAGNVSATTFRNNPVTVNVLSSDSSPGTLTPSSVTVITQPTSGSAVAQTDGTIVYTPASGFTGSDTFTYTVSDSNAQTSTPGTVTISVGVPTPPVAADLTDSAFEGTPATLNISGHATAVDGTIAPGTIVISTVPTHGTAQPQADGTVLYTPTAGYVGTDEFDYTISDSLGDASNVASDTITITHAAPPVLSNSSSNVLTGQGNVINVLANTTGGAPLLPTGVAVTTAPANGTYTIDSTTGAINYTPNANFVGVDSFSYTVEDVNLDTSDPATVTLNVGTTLSNEKNATHSLTFINNAGGSETISLNTGSAQIFFGNSTGTLAVAKNGKGTIATKGLSVAGITLSGTTNRSTLTLKGVAKTPLAVGGISDASPLGGIAAPYANVTGDITLASAGAVSLSSFTTGTMTVGAASPGHLALTIGAVNANLTSAVPITALKVASWNGGSLSAPSIGTLTDASLFSADFTLKATGKTPAINSARIVGALAGGTWSVTGTVNSLTAGSAAAAWNGSFNGLLNSFTIKSGGLTSGLTAGTLGSLTVTGAISGGTLTAQSAKLIHVIGSLTGTTVSISGAGGLKQLTVSGAITNSNVISAAGPIGTLTAGSISGSNVSAGVPSTTTFGTASATDLGASSIGTLKTGAFANTNVLAAKITNAALGAVTANNGGTAFGVAVKSINAFSGVFGSIPVKFGHAQLVNEEVLSAFVNQLQPQLFVDFGLAIEG